jgi:pilus assembly protein TadC
MIPNSDTHNIVLFVFDISVIAIAGFVISMIVVTLTAKNKKQKKEAE